MTSVAVLALAATRIDVERAARGGEWLEVQEGQGLPWYTPIALWVERLRGNKLTLDLNPRLKGWPWREGTFAWAEPTAMALLALRALARAPGAERDSRRDERIEQGELLLVDRMVPGGGWNYGNSRVLGEDLEAYPDTTAWVLLALHGSPRAAREVEASFVALDRLMHHNESLLARALTVLARRAYGREAEELARTVATQALDAESPTDARTRALSVLALAGSSNPLVGATHA